MGAQIILPARPKCNYDVEWKGPSQATTRIRPPRAYGRTVRRERFNKLVEEALNRLPAKFRKKIKNVAVVVEDLPPQHGLHVCGDSGEGLLMGVFEGTPVTEKSVWDAQPGPDRIVLYQKNIEAACETEDEIREEVRLTVLHELGHYFGMTEDQLEDV